MVLQVTIHCPTCKGSGYEKLEAPSGRMVDTPCTCSIGHAILMPFIGPPMPTSAWLLDNETDKHRAAMKAADRWECWTCDDWHEAGEKCPIASKPTGWLAPQYRKGVTA